jgi:hypothetical protein
MMKLLPMKLKHPTTWREGEPLISLLCGVPAVGIGLVVLIAIILLSRPTGTNRFFIDEDVSVVERDSRGLVTYHKPATAAIPSVEILGILSAGMSCAGLGIYLSRRRRPHCRVTTCKAGMISCATVFFILWLMIVLAALR